MAKKLKRMICPMCDNTVAVYPNQVLARHKDRDGQKWCPYSDAQRSRIKQGLPPHNFLPGTQFINPLEDVESGRAPQEWINDGTSIATGGPVGMFDSGPATGELADWWREMTERDIRKCLPKVHEYSAYDMLLIGKTTADMVGYNAVPAPYDYAEAPDPDYIEIGCWWYLLGKIGRAIGAIKEGRLPSDDTIEDVRIYATMIARTRDAGGWPGSTR